MKQITILTLVMILFTSCFLFKKKQQATTEKFSPVVDTTNRSVMGILLLHPVKNVYEGGNKNYYSLYDYGKKYLYLTDQESIADTVQSFLPEYITTQNIGREVRMPASSIDPFSTLTKEVLDKIKETKGIEFAGINNYRIAKSFSIKMQNNSRHAMESLRSMLTGTPGPADTMTTTMRFPITGAQGMLTYYPIENLLKGEKGNNYFFLDHIHNIMFVTKDAELQEKFKKSLPMLSNKENAVIVQGVTIKPITRFTPAEMIAMQKDQGFTLSGDSLNKGNINQYKLATIESYAIVEDYHSVITEIDQRLGVSVPPQRNRRENQTPQTNSNERIGQPNIQVPQKKPAAAPATVTPVAPRTSNGRKPGG